MRNASPSEGSGEANAARPFAAMAPTSPIARNARLFTIATPRSDLSTDPEPHAKSELWQQMVPHSGARSPYSEAPGGKGGGNPMATETTAERGGFRETVRRNQLIVFVALSYALSWWAWIWFHLDP